MAILLGVANVAAYLAYTLPRSLRKRNVATRVEQLGVELAEERARVATLKARAEAIKANRTESRTFLDQKVARPEMSLAPILAEVELLAKKEGLEVGTQGFSRETVEGLPLDKFEINMPVSGTYEQITGLLVQLERSRYFFTLDTIAARHRESGGQSGVGLNLQFSAYFRRETEVASR